MPANFVDYFTVTPGQKCAVLQAGTAGVVSIVMAKKVRRNVPTLAERLAAVHEELNDWLDARLAEERKRHPSIPIGPLRNTLARGRCV